MSDEFGNTPPEGTYVPPPPPPPGYTQAPQSGYTQTPPPPPGYLPPATSSGLSDSMAGALAYVTIIPAIIFLLLEPYKDRPFVKFHCIQSIGLSIVWFLLHFFWVIPLLGWIVAIVGYLVLFIVWILCILKASQGGSFKLPVIGKFAVEQSRYSA
jgi:uncharacterized membrane protein